MTPINAFGNRIRQRRIAMNLRTEDVAKQVGYAPQTLRSIERGEVLPKDTSRVEALSHILAMPFAPTMQLVEQSRKAQVRSLARAMRRRPALRKATFLLSQMNDDTLDNVTDLFETLSRR